MVELFHTLITSQYLASLATLRQSIERCDEESWGAAHLDTAVNQVVFHTLIFTDLYLGPGTEGFEKQRFHLDRPDFFRSYEEFENKIPTNTYPRTGCVEYLAHCVEKVKSVVPAESETTLAGTSGFSWRTCSRAELHVYNIRHIQHHAAQLGLRHQLLGGEPLKWVGEVRDS